MMIFTRPMAMCVAILLIISVGAVLATERFNGTDDCACKLYEGAQLYYAGKFKKARLFFESYLKKCAASGEHNIVLSYTYLGLIYNKIGVYDRAVSVLTDAIKIHPESATLHKALGYAYFKKGKSSRAIVEFRRSLDINPEIKYAHYYMALIFQSLGDYKRALKELKKEQKVNNSIEVKRKIEEINSVWIR